MLRSYEDLRIKEPNLGRDSLTERELDIMSVLWRYESGTVSEVREGLADEPGYTTVLKILQILEEKGAIRHETEGRAYRYYPLVAPEEEGGRALKKILDKIFHGSAELMLARLVSDTEISRDQIERMRLLLEDAASRAEEEDR
ncbi:MAG: BlaI/MecI/CopY family transcriptional regulator [Gemmatimonadetes bacterium]|nr:BlaI/MecI/CopY family transcriptional regulator [Gemmatimonadota bacterium]